MLKCLNVKMSKGFTIIELLVVAVIVVLFLTIILANYRNSQGQLDLQRSAHKLAQDIRRSQEMVMSARECPIAKCGSPAIVPSRYGLEFKTGRNYYILFADINDNGKYEPPSPDSEVETIIFEKGIRIEALFAPTSITEAWVAFKPPDPLTTIRSPGERSSLEIRLINANSQTKKVKVNKVGLIEIE